MYDMDTEEAERVVVAKPVASRPLRNFSDILAVEVNSIPTNVNSETAVAAIRPKAVRFKPMVLPASSDVITSQAETYRKSVSSPSDKDLVSNSKLNVVYKPIAKLVPEAAFSLLANMGKFSTAQQQSQPGVEGGTQSKHQNKQNFRLHAETRESQEGSSKFKSKSMEENPKCLTAPTRADRPCYDGYNWRKYGQKQVKGSECPRGYYKCTYPNCPVKKKVERWLDGQIAEIVYKGDHNHPKLLPPKHKCSTTQGLGLVPNRIGQDAKSSVFTNKINDKSERSDSRLENHNVEGHGKVPRIYDPAGMTETDVATSENFRGLRRDYEAKEESKGIKGEFGNPGNKKRKSEKQAIEAGISGDAVQGPPTLVQNSTESEISGDGFRWRKYGQKVVKGNSYPRSYYRCTSPKCNARKHVERASDDPDAIINTYAGKHNHDISSKNTNSAASKRDSPIAKNKP